MDFDFTSPKYKYDPANYEPQTGPAFQGAPQPNYDFSAPTEDVPAPMLGVNTTPAPLYDFAAPRPQPFSIDTSVPVQGEPTLEQRYENKFGGAPREPSVGMETAPPPPAPTAQPPAARTGGGLGLDQALQLVQAGQGGGVRDPRAVQQFRSLQGERQQMYEQAAQGAERFGAETQVVQDQIAGALEERRQWQEQWAADEQKRQAERQERAREYQSRIENKSREAAGAAASIDGNRLMSGGGGVLMTLGMALGAFGSAVARTPNFAVQIVQSALDRDFEAQKENVRGKDREVSMLRDIYDGFRAEGRDELESKLAARAVMLDTYASKVEQMSVRLQGAEGKERGAQAAQQLRFAANEEKLKAAELAARPRGTGKSAAEMAEQALKLQKMSLENEATQKKLAGEDPEQKTVISVKDDVDKNLAAINTSLDTIADLDQYSSEGYKTVPGAPGGLNPFKKDTWRGAGTSLSQTFGGGTGESELEGRIRSGMIAHGSMKFFDTMGSTVKSDSDTKQAEELAQGNQSLSAARSDIRKTAGSAIQKTRLALQSSSIGKKDRALYEAQLQALESKLKSVGTDPNDYRKAFGKKE